MANEESILHEIEKIFPQSEPGQPYWHPTLPHFHTFPPATPIPSLHGKGVALQALPVLRHYQYQPQNMAELQNSSQTLPKATTGEAAIKVKIFKHVSLSIATP
jgi:hypothetical protein